MSLSFKPKSFFLKAHNFIRGIKFGQGTSMSTSCALARPYTQLIEEGKPIGRINYIFFQVNRWPSRILGSLCFTPGQQLLFYPGVVERNVNWLFSRRKGFTSIKSNGLVNHVTLEKGFRRSLVTVLKADGTKSPRLPSYRIKMVMNLYALK